MKQTASAKTPAPKPEESSRRPSAVFISMALDMSWRLAIVVLVPIVGGFKLDEALEMTPVLTILGFFVAMTGMGLVMWSTLQKANRLTMPTPKEGSHAK